MSAYDAWLGAKVDDSFRLTPASLAEAKRHGPFFPTAYRAWQLVRARPETVAISYLVDACVLKKSEIVDLVHICSAYDRLDHLVARWSELRTYVDALADGRYVVGVSGD
jgi:hypothetical protein